MLFDHCPDWFDHYPFFVYNSALIPKKYKNRLLSSYLAKWSILKIRVDLL
jgi:hypothetical protein